MIENVLQPNIANILGSSLVRSRIAVVYQPRLDKRLAPDPRTGARPRVILYESKHRY